MNMQLSTVRIPANRIYWNYCIDDWHFAKMIYSLVRPGGMSYIDTNTADWNIARGILFPSARLMKRMKRRLFHSVYVRLAWKIDEYYMLPRGRIASRFSSLPVQRILVDC